MSLHRLTRSGPITQQRRIGLVLVARVQAADWVKAVARQ